MKALASRRRLERGSVTIEAVIIVPALLLFAGLVLAAGRVTIAHQGVDLAAAEAARSASLTRSPSEAQTGATDSAASTLADRGLHCRSQSVALDTSGFWAPFGTDGRVAARVICVVDLSDVAVPGLPGAITIAADASSPLDRYRERRR